MKERKIKNKSLKTGENIYKKILKKCKERRVLNNKVFIYYYYYYYSNREKNYGRREKRGKKLKGRKLIN